MKFRAVSWLIASLATALISFAIAFFFTDLIVVRGMTAGWLLALLNGITAAVVNRKAIGKGSSRFLLLTVCGILVRVVLVIGSVYAAYIYMVREELASFVITVLVGMFVYMVRENVSLYRGEDLPAGGRDKMETKTE